MATADALRQGLECLRAGRLAEGERFLRQVLSVEPNNAVALHHLGLLAQHVNNLPAALEFMRKAAQAAPTSIEYLGRLALLLESLGQIAEARECYLRAADIPGMTADSFAGGAAALGRMFFLDDALAFSRRALALDPRNGRAYNNLGQAHASLGEVEKAVDAFREAVRFGNPSGPHNFLFYLHFHPAYDGRMIYEEHRNWAKQHADPLAKAIPPKRNLTGGKLRIGYVSSEFFDHPVGRLIEPVLANHDRSQFEIVCYSGVTRPDAVTTRHRSHATLWRDVLKLNDEQLAQVIHEDQIDILVDLTLHMSGSRLLAFARRPAPVQVTWLGYPGTTGLAAMDYRITDPHLDPPGPGNESEYSEKMHRLPHSFWPYAGPSEAPPVNPLPAATNGYVTFASFNNLLKFNEGVYDAFAAILHAVPSSRLLMLNNRSAAALSSTLGS